MRTSLAAEPLEPRLVLSAPAATITDFDFGYTEWVVSVLFEGDTPVDPSTIGDGDIGFTGPAGARQGMLMEAPTPGPTPGSYAARFRHYSPGGRTDWTDSGEYQFSFAPGAVANTLGEVMTQTDAGRYPLWFDAPQVTVDTAYASSGHFSGSFSFAVHISTQPGLTLGGTSLGWDGLRVFVFGTSGELLPAGSVAPGPWEIPFAGRGSSADVGVYFVPEDYQFDWLDNGPHRIVMTLYREDANEGDILGGQYWLWFNNPGARVVSTQVRNTDVLATVEYGDDAPIDIGTIGNGDLRFYAVGVTSRLGVLLNAPTVQPDGTVRAEYRFDSLLEFGWSGLNNGAAGIVVRNEEVRSTDGQYMAPAAIHREVFTFDSPSVAFLDGETVSPTEWQFRVIIADPHSLVNRESVDTLDIRLDGPGGPLHATSVSFVWAGPGPLVITYRVRPQAERFVNGPYELFIEPGQIFLSDGRDWGISGSIGHWYLWFPE